MARSILNKRERIIAQMRQRIVAGEWLPGSRLPTRMDLIEQYQISAATAQAVLDELSHDQFIETQGRRGTFVAKHPPHLSHIVLITREADHDPAHGSHFYVALSRQIRVLEKRRNCRVTVLQGQHGRLSPGDEADLLEEIRAHRIAGIVFSWPPYEWVDTPLLAVSGLPRVAISSATIPGVDAVFPDWDSFAQQAVAKLVAHGVKRVAILAAQQAIEPLQKLVRHATQAGLDCPPLLQQYASLQPPLAAERHVQLLLALPAQQRPQALIISDDNLVPNVTTGLKHAALTHARDLLLIAHANFPHTTPSRVPAYRLGFDVTQILSTCFDLIAAHRKQQSPMSVVKIPAMWSSDLSCSA